jgi:hypothetical protein
VRRFDDRVSGEAEISVTLVVGNDQDDVGAGGRGLPAARERECRREGGYPSRDGFQKIAAFHRASFKVLLNIVGTGVRKVNPNDLLFDKFSTSNMMISGSGFEADLIGGEEKNPRLKPMDLTDFVIACKTSPY